MNSLQYLQANLKLIPLNSDFTIEFDIYLNTNINSYGEIISQGGQPNSFYIGVNPQLGIRLGDTWIDSGTKLTIKKWTHLAVSHATTGAGNFYLDGELFSSNNQYILNQAGADTRVGVQYDDNASERIDGCMDNLIVWKSVRISAEVKADSQSKNAISDSQLLSFFDFDLVNSAGLFESSISKSDFLTPLVTPVLLNSANPVPAVAPEFKYIGGILNSPSGWDGPGFYVTADLKTEIPDNFRSGFGWYSTLWPIAASQLNNF